MSQPPPPPMGAPAPGPLPAGPSGPRAGFWVRLAGALIDGIIIGIPLNLILLAVDIDNAPVPQLVGFVAGLLYTVYFIGSPSGQTVGMRLLSIRAVDAETGGRIDYGRAAVRDLVALVSAIPCGLGYLWMLWDPEKQTWHDKVARTYVVPTDVYPVERWPG
jgi:uncharacterized RDD family membrane protein YckC